MLNTLVVNFYGGPGVSKSTMAAGVYSALKWRHRNVELVGEFAKDLTWEERHKTLKDQIYILGEQYHRIFRLLGQVDAIITDSPIILSPIYDSEKRPLLKELAHNEHKKMWTYDVFLTRVKPYNPKGRNQSEAEAKELDKVIATMLEDNLIPYETFPGSEEGQAKIVEKIILLLDQHDRRA